MTQTNAVSQVAQLIQQASQAQQQFESYNQTAVDELVTAVAWALVNPENNKMLSELAVAETGLGNVADRITEKHWAYCVI
jgi:sulfoacetaldehyde dehydrogenase